MSVATGRVVVAEYAASALKDGETALFSTEAGESPAALPQEFVRGLSPAYSELYARLIEALTPSLAASGLPAKAARVVLRDAVPSVAHFALDRALRLDRLVAALGAGGLAVRAETSRPLAFSRAASLREEATSSREFNEAALGRLAPALGLAVVEGLPAAVPPAPSAPFRNYNFEGRSLGAKLKGHAHRLVAKAWPGRIPALSLAYASFVLRDEGFFGMGGLEFVGGRARFPESPRRPDMRETLRAVLLERRALLADFLGRAGARAVEPLSAACAGLMAEIFPSDAWEGAAAHYAAADGLLAGFDSRVLVLTETGNAEATFLLAAAKARGMETVGVQDGGHYGYMDDVVSVVECEFPQFDRYLTWGWTRFPEDAAGLGGVEAVPLPSPWLSEKRRQWRRELGEGPAWWEADREHDLLLMSNRVNAFPPAPSGAAVCRSDHAPAVASELKDLVARASAAGVSVLHKSYNARTMRLLAGTLEELRVLGGPRYAQVERLDKGLHAGLIGRARLALWDQPGTGFLECLAGSLPTMVLWGRLYNREAPAAAADFALLERAGLVHRTPASLLAEYARFKAGPTVWMREPSRRAAIDGFLSRYARLDDGWTGPWREWLKAACSRR